MFKWRVMITFWNGSVINKYFHNKTCAYQFFESNYTKALAIQIFQYNGQIWKNIKFYL